MPGLFQCRSCPEDCDPNEDRVWIVVDGDGPAWTRSFRRFNCSGIVCGICPGRAPFRSREEHAKVADLAPRLKDAAARTCGMRSAITFPMF